MSPSAMLWFILAGLFFFCFVFFGGTYFPSGATEVDQMENKSESEWPRISHAQSHTRGPPSFSVARVNRASPPWFGVARSFCVMRVLQHKMLPTPTSPRKQSFEYLLNFSSGINKVFFHFISFSFVVILSCHAALSH